MIDDCNTQNPLHVGRVLIVTPQPFYEDRGTPIAIRLVARALTELGYQVDILAFPLGETISIPGLKIYRIPNPLRIRAVPIGFSWRKLLLDIGLRRSLRKRLRVTAYDCVHAVEEAAYLCMLASRQDIPFIYDMASSIPEQLAARPPFAGRLQQVLLRRLERATLNAAAYVLCSSGLEAHVRSAQIRERVESWQYPPSSTLSSAQDRVRLRQELGIPDYARVVVYAGSFADYQGLEVLIDAIPKVRHRLSDVFFVLVGGTTREVDAIRSKMDPRTARSVRLLRRQPNAKIGAFLACADLLVSTRRTGANLPIKVFDYLITGKPVLVSEGPAHKAILHHNQVSAFENNSHALATLIFRTLPDSRSDGHSPESVEPIEGALLEELWNNFRSQIERVYADARRSNN